MTPGGRVLWGLLIAVLVVLCCGGCGQRDSSRSSQSLAGPRDLGQTIGHVAKAVYPQALPLEGYGLVGGLPGTGSAECPPGVRAYLRRYAQSQVSGSQSVDLDGLLISRQAAVVYVEAVLPPASLKGERFDVKVTAFSRAETTSLEGGWLFTGELNPKGLAAVPVRSLALAEGPVYVDRLSSSAVDRRAGYVLGGGRLLEQPQVLVILRNPDFRTASLVRNLINERFGPDTARALSPTQIELQVPLATRQRRSRFFAMVEAIYLDQTPEVIQDRVTTLVRTLAAAADKTPHEVALEAIGPASLAKLEGLLQSPDEQTRLAAARCMANQGSLRGLQALVRIAFDSTSPRRDQAVKALAVSGRSPEAVSALVGLLADPHMEVSLTAYEELLKVDPRAVSSAPIGGGAFLDEIPGGAGRAIVTFRSVRPRVALFGQVTCRPGRLLESTDGTITLDSRASDASLLATRRHPVRRSVIGRVRCSAKVHDLIQVLCGEPPSEAQGQGGLGVSYSGLVSLLKQACDSGFVDADFWAGPLPGSGQ